MRRFAVSAVCTLAFACGGAGLAFAEGVNRSVGIADRRSDELPPATQTLLEAYPGLHTHVIGESIRAIFGSPMGEGATPEEAKDAWLAAHQGAFGITNLELAPFFSNDVSWGKFWVFAYKQTMAGIPVENTTGRILVLTGTPNKVVYAGGIFAQPPQNGFAADTVTAEQAVAMVGSMPLYQGLSTWTAPDMVIYAGEESHMANGSFTPVRAWKFVGDNGDLADRRKLTFFVDAATGRLVNARNEIHHVDVSGTVTGLGSPGTVPDIAGNPAASMVMPEIRVSITGGSTVFGNRDGTFTVPNAGSTAVTVTSSVAAGATTGGRWVTVNNSPGAEITASASVTPPGPANLIYNSAPSALTTAQVNAFVHTNHIHNFIKDRTSWTGMDIVMPANVNIASTCNAYYDGASINFYQAGGGCSNTSYSSVVAHEYGHGIVNNLGLSQGAFGEGFGDCCSELLYDDPVIGRNFQGTSPVRNYSPGQPEDPYPCAGSCGGEVHCCGEILGGFWWDVREQFGVAYGSAPGLTEVQQLFVDWSQITNGGSGSNSAHPQTIIEMLTVDDNDGDINNGTPNYSLICAAASAHSIPCPALSLVTFNFPSGLPTLLTPSTPTNIAVNVVGVAGTPTPGSGTVSYRVNGGSFTTIAMAQGAPNQYTATLPGVACGSLVDYYFTSGTSGGPASSPATAPAATYSVSAAYGTINVLTDDFQGNLGWSVGPADTATTGIWTRVDPVGTAAQPENDHTAGAGTICWVTGQGVVGGAIGDNDVDGGLTRLSSPVLNFAGASGATVEYWRWYSNDQGSAPNADTFRVEISNNGGTSWVLAETVGPTGAETAGGWFFHQINVASFVAPTNNVRVRFIAEDGGSGSIIEAAVDDFRAYALDCNPPAGCTGDLNNDGVIDIGDLTVLLANFGTASGAGPEDGDMDNDGDVDLSDLSGFLALFGTPCP